MIKKSKFDFCSNELMIEIIA